MTGAERKRAWRAQHPERGRASERERAAARRREFWDEMCTRPCASGDAYWRYEHSWMRLTQRLWYPTLGAGAHRLTQKQRGKAITEWGRRKRAEFALRFVS